MYYTPPFTECGYFLGNIWMLWPWQTFSSADHGFNTMCLRWFWHHQQNVFKDHLDSAVRENCSKTEVRHEGALFQFFISKKITRALSNLAYFSLQWQRNLLLWYVFEMQLTATQSTIYHCTLHKLKCPSPLNSSPLWVAVLCKRDCTLNQSSR